MVEVTPFCLQAFLTGCKEFCDISQNTLSETVAINTIYFDLDSIFGTRILLKIHAVSFNCCKLVEERIQYIPHTLT
jgi:hypothetical protein